MYMPDYFIAKLFNHAVERALMMYKVHHSKTPSVILVHSKLMNADFHLVPFCFVDDQTYYSLAY